MKTKVLLITLSSLLGMSHANAAIECFAMAINSPTQTPLVENVSASSAGSRVLEAQVDGYEITVHADEVHRTVYVQSLRDTQTGVTSSTGRRVVSTGTNEYVILQKSSDTRNMRVFCQLTEN